MKFVTYDPSTGQITGRITCGARQAENYPVRRAITDEEADAQPELTLKVNLSDVDGPLITI